MRSINKSTRKLLSDFYSSWISNGDADYSEIKQRRAPAASQESDRSTFYIKRASEVDYVYELSYSDLAEELLSVWGDDSASPERASMAQALATLADQLRDLPDEQAEVSGTLYVLF